MDPDTIGHICHLFNHSVSCEYLFSTDIPLPRDYDLAAKKCYSTEIEYTGGGVHDAIVYKKINYKSTSTDEHTYDENLRNISSCSVDSEEDIKQQISDMDDSICRNHSSRYPSLRLSSIAHNNTHDSPATQQSHLPCSKIPYVAPELGKGQTTTGQQIEGSEVATLLPGKSNAEHCSVSKPKFALNEKKMTEVVSHLSHKRNDGISVLSDTITTTYQQIEVLEVVTLSPGKSNDEYCSGSEQNISPDEEKMSVAVSPLSDKRTDDISFIPSSLPPEKMSEAVSPLSDKRTDDISFIPSILPLNKNGVIVNESKSMDNSFAETILALGTKRKMSFDAEYTNGIISSSNDVSTENKIAINSPIGEGNSSRVSLDDQGNKIDIPNDVYGDVKGVLAPSSEKLSEEVSVVQTEKDSRFHSKEGIVLLDGESYQGKHRVSETVPACKKFKITSTRALHAYDALDIYFASNPIEYGSLSESWNILATSLMQGKWLIVYSMI